LENQKIKKEHISWIKNAHAEHGPACVVISTIYGKIKSMNHYNWTKIENKNCKIEMIWYHGKVNWAKCEWDIWIAYRSYNQRNGNSRTT
jgi:hypothetical protein